MPVRHVQFLLLKRLVWFIFKPRFFFLVFPSKPNRNMNRRHIYFWTGILPVFREEPELFSLIHIFKISLMSNTYRSFISCFPHSFLNQNWNIVVSSISLYFFFHRQSSSPPPIRRRPTWSRSSLVCAIVASLRMSIPFLIVWGIV